MRDSRREEPRPFRDARVARLAEAFVVCARQVERVLYGRHFAMNRHLQDAAASLLANIGEALDEPSLGDKARFLRYAQRSAGECERLLRGLRRLRAIPTGLADDGLRHLRDIKLDLIRLTRWAGQ